MWVSFAVKGEKIRAKWREKGYEIVPILESMRGKFKVGLRILGTA